MSNLFISHSSRDNAAAKELQAKLEEQGHRSVFLDLDPETGIQAGVSWERTLYTKLRACRAVVALCSDSYLASQWCFAEIALARMEGKELFVLQIDPWSKQTQMPSILTEEQFIDLRTNKDDGYQRLWNGFKVKGIVAAEAREWKPEEPPYPGLRAFREEDAPIFFGRDEEIRAGNELLNRVRRQGHPRLVMVLGSSGSGKSSLVRAGIVPQLRRDRGQWLVVKPFRPGPQPARELAASLSLAFDEAGQAFGWEEIHRWLEPEGDHATAPISEPPAADDSEPTPAAARDRLLQALSAMESELSAADDQVTNSMRRLKDYLSQQQTEAPPVSVGAPPPSVPSPLAELASRLRLQSGFAEATVVLIIDQFEELLGHDSKHSSSRFLKMLRAAMEAEGSPLLVIGTMRSDYLGVLQRSVPFQGLGFKSLSVGPMSKEGMRQIIEEPAKLGQIELENGLSDLLLEDTETSDALPLLAFTLRMMWDRYHDNRLLEISEYKDFGRLQGAIAQVADETYEDVLEQVQDAESRDALARDLRDAFLSMARPAAEGSGWSRQPVNWDQLSTSVQPALAPFIDPQRLLVKRPDGTVEVAHEALFRSWNRLKEWLNENAEGLHLLREIQVEAKKWNEVDANEKAEYLWSGGRLARALELREAGVLPLQDLDRAFVEASEGAEKAALEAEAARRHQRLRQARRLAIVLGSAAVITLVFGLWAWSLKVDANRNLLRTRDALRISAVREMWPDAGTTHTRVGLLREVEANDPAAVRGWMDLRLKVLKEPVTEVILRSPKDSGTVMSSAYSSDGTLLFTAYEDGTAYLWQFESLDDPIPLPGDKGSGSVSTAAFSRDGELLFTGYDDGTGKVWRTSNPGKPIKLPGPKGSKKVTAVAFSFDAEHIAVAYLGGMARSWKIDGSIGVHFPTTGDEASNATVALAFTPNNNRLITVHRDGTARASNAEGVMVPAFEPAKPPTQGLSFAAFDPDVTRVVTAAESETARVSSLDGSGDTLELPGTTDRALCGGFSPDGKRIVIGYFSGAVRMWNDDGSGLRVFNGHASQYSISSVEFSHDNLRIVTSSGDKTARVWGVDDNGEPIVLRGHTAYLRSASFNRDGSHIVTASEDGTARIWNVEPWGKPTHVVVEEDPMPIRAATFSLKGGRIQTIHSDGSAWEVQLDGSAKPRKSREITEKWVKSAAFRDKGVQSITVHDAESLLLWNPNGSSKPIPLSKRDRAANSVALSADGARVAIGYEDGTARVWDLEAPLSYRFDLQSSQSAGNPVNAIAFNADGMLIVTGSEDGRTGVWKVGRKSELLAELPVHEKTPAGDGSPVTATAFSHDGTRIVTGHTTGVTRMFKLNANGSVEPMLVLPGPDDSVTATAFSADDNRLLLGYDNGQARTWELTDPALLWRRTRVCPTVEERRTILDQDQQTAETNFARCRRMVRCLHSTPLESTGPEKFDKCYREFRETFAG